MKAAGRGAVEDRIEGHGEPDIANAVADPGHPEEIGQVFAGFQKYLYQDVA